MGLLRGGTIRPNSLPRAHDQGGIVGETRDVFVVL